MAQEERLICASSELVERGAGVRFSVERFGQTEPAFVVRFNGVPRGFINRCAHVPTELDWNPGEFFDFDRRLIICATHGALYYPATGACVGGRCNGRGLRPLPMTEHDGGIFLIEGNDDE